MYIENQLFDRINQAYQCEKSVSQVLNDEEVCYVIYEATSELRGILAKALVFEEKSDYAVHLLHQLSLDTDSLVRAEAVDSISSFSVEESFNVLCEALNDVAELVRFYAALGLGYIGKDINSEQATILLQNALRKEQNSFPLIGIYSGLYFLGSHKMLEKLMALFMNQDYHIQCCVLHILAELIDSTNWVAIRSFAHSLDPSQFSAAVVDALSQLLDAAAAISN